MLKNVESKKEPKRGNSLKPSVTISKDAPDDE
jgi:hypothetical protein